MDLDGDGDDDIVLPYGDFFLTILVAQARGVFGPPIQIWDEDTPLAVDGDPGWTWDFGDLDGDGATEILAGRTAILNSTTTPAFAEYLPKGAIDPITIFVAAGDVSGDGIDDFTMLTQPNQIEILVSGPQLD